MYTAEGRKRKTVYGKTRAEVARKLNRALADCEGGLYFDDEGLKWSDVDLEAKALRVNRQLQRLRRNGDTPGRLVFAEPKNASRRMGRQALLA